MTRSASFRRPWIAVYSGILIFVAVQGRALADPPPAAVAAFNTYISALESRVAQRHHSPNAFLVPADSTRLRRGDLLIQQLTPSGGEEFPGALLHDWRGTAFVAGAHADDFERILSDFDAYPQRFSPQVIRTRILTQQGNHFHVLMRVRQQHIITVVLDTYCDVTFVRLDAGHGYSISRSTQISEIDSPGSSREQPLDARHEHGFLWRLNTYWSYEERDGGLYLQIESVSLTRSIPHGLGWAVGPFVESVPYDSLEFTLRGACSALKQLDTQSTERSK